MALLRFFSLIGREYKAASLGLLASLCSTFASIALMATAGWFLTAMAYAALIGISLNLFVPSALIRLLAILRTGLRYADRLLSHAAAFKIIEQFRGELFDKALALSYQSQLKFQQADLERRLHGDIEKLELVYLREFVPIISAFITGLIAGLILLAFSVKLLYIFAACFVLAGILVPLISAKFFSRVSARSSEDLLSLNNETAVFISGLFDFVVLNAVPQRLERLEELNSRICKSRRTLAVIEGINQAVLMLCASLCFLGLIASSALLYRNGGISSAQCMMLAIGALAAFECLQPMAAALLLWPEAEHSAKRVFELMDGKRREEGTETLKGELKTISCEKLTFAYIDRKPIFTDLTVSFESDKNYALTGPLGCGKSTLLFMLLGLIKPNSGRILFDGLESSKLKGSALNAQFSVCFQDPSLMSGNLREIFNAVDSSITDAQILDCLKLVELYDFVSTELPDGLDTYIGEHGRALSGGQARRLSLARALCRRAPFLLLDEPGEGLDKDQEERILERILSSRKGVIMVSHRSAGLSLCDKHISL